MPKTKISEFSATPANNTDIDSINIAEGCAPSGINDAIRELMSQLKDFQVGTAGDPVTVGGVLTVTAGAVGTPAITTAGDTNTGIFFPAADTIAFAEGGAEVARFNSAGIFGLGVTPSSYSLSGCLDLANGRIISFGGSDGNFSANAYFNSVWKYKTTDVATNYSQTLGEHHWFTAASGTAGNNVTFTQAMTLDASGNLCVGTTTSSPITTRISGTANGILVSGANWPALCVQDSTNSTYFGFLAQNNADLLVWNTASGNLKFGTADDERARINSSGHFLVGVTTQQGGGGSCIQGGTGVNSLQMQNNGASPYGPYINFSAASPNNGTQYFINCADTTTARMFLYSNGGLANYSANNVNLSDRREKTNFSPATSYLDKICAIPVQTFNYIDQNMEVDGGLTLGVVAQDVQAVAPELVMESNWAGKDEEPKMRLSIYQTDLQYALMKCIQEQQALITQLQADVAALKV